MNFFREKVILGHPISRWGLVLLVFVSALLNVSHCVETSAVSPAPTDVSSGFEPSLAKPPNVTIGAGTR